MRFWVLSDEMFILLALFLVTSSRLLCKYKYHKQKNTSGNFYSDDIDIKLSPVKNPTTAPERRVVA